MDTASSQDPEGPMRGGDRRFIVAGSGPSLSSESFSAESARSLGYRIIGVHSAARIAPHDLLIFDQEKRFSTPERAPRRLEILDAIRDPRIEQIWCRELSTWEGFRLDPRKRIFQIQNASNIEEIADCLRGKTNPLYLPHYKSSVFAACSLAFKMGATWIGIIGLDLTGHPSLEKYADKLNERFLWLGEAMDSLGVQLVNLSQQSMITTLPHEDLP